MNQILVTEKLYVTPEIRVKKRFYKLTFMLSIFLIIILCSCYIYAEYDRNKESEVSKNILEDLSIFVNYDEPQENDDDDVWRVIVASKEIIEEQPKVESEGEETSTPPTTTKYTASNGKTYDILGRITIPKINVDYVILADTADIVDLLKVLPCRFYGPKTPNEVGNFCIAGHNYRNKRFFSKVPTLVVGDIIEITDLTGTTVKYAIYDKYTVDPEDVSCLDQVTNGKKIVTLITCTDDSKQRVIVQAKEVI